MSIRTTLTLDDDVAERVKQESRSRGDSFRDTLNDMLREALVHLRAAPPRSRSLIIKPTHMGFRAGINHDDVESLIEFGEGEQHR
jgi:hypothetical protein